MKPSSPSSEATLLFPATAKGALEELKSEIELIALAHDLVARAAPNDHANKLSFDCGEIEILVTGSDKPMKPARFLDAARPDSAEVAETEILARLTSHVYSVTVCVTGRDDLVPEKTALRHELKRTLCWQITESLRGLGDAWLVFWDASETLYAGEEFARASLAGDAEPELLTVKPEAERLRVSPARAEHVYDLETRALTYIQTQIIQGAHRTKRQRHPLVETMRSGLMLCAPPAQAAIALARRNSQDVMRGTTMACSTAAMGICLIPGLFGGSV